jgi:hypothetical protein
MAGGARSGDLEPAWVLMAAFQLAVFDLKYGKFPRAGRPAGPDPGQTEFSGVRAYTPYPGGLAGENLLAAICRPGDPVERQLTLRAIVGLADGGRISVTGKKQRSEIASALVSLRA